MTLQETAQGKPFPHVFVDGLHAELRDRFKHYCGFENVLWTRRDIACPIGPQSEERLPNARALSLYARDARGQHRFIAESGERVPVRLIVRGICHYDTFKLSLHNDEWMLPPGLIDHKFYDRWVWCARLELEKYLRTV